MARGGGSAADNPAAAAFDDASVEPGVWRYEKARRVAVIVDGAPYFALMQQAMLKAHQRILLIGWDFDTRIHLTVGRRWWQRRRKGRFPSRLGSFILWLARHRDGLQIFILKWSFGFIKFFARGTMLLDLLRWAPKKQIDFKFDIAHPLGCSHHQKIVVIDDELAVCGGIDMTTRRWDTPDHCEQDPRRKQPNGRPYGPWHDATTMIEGEAARALGELGRDRWLSAGGGELAACRVPSESAWPDELAAQFEDVEIGIARTRAEYRGRQAVSEIKALFLDHIGRAERFIYAESQYFASRAIADAFARRLAEPDPPEIVLVNPATADGWLESEVMDSARARLLRALGKEDHRGRFHVYTPVCGDQPIYVHAKIMIVDDEILRVGSANMNNRSLGLDTECDLFIDAARPGNESARSAIRDLRYRLLTEHCGLEAEQVGELLSEAGSMAAMIDKASNDCQKALRRYQVPDLTEPERAAADSCLFDPESPDEMFEPIARRRGLFGHGRMLRRP